MKSTELRKTFVDYFAKKGHLYVPSSSLVPQDDPTLLFNNAGMNQFKNAFIGLEQPEQARAVSIQKCVRAGGKHNDLENVGHTARHHTFFEMMGNFSFGDYFKKDAIHFAWEFLTKELQLPKDRLYVTVFETDDEAAEIWNRQEGVPLDRISRFGEKDNFWRMGDSGPCGPCSEIFYDHGEQYGPHEKVGGDGDRFVEIWNLVFMQYYEDPQGKMTPLPSPSIDTGSGLERVLATLQGVVNNYDTDLFSNMIGTASRMSGHEYVTDLAVLNANPHLMEITSAMRVLADHARASAFLIADGVLPSNEGRGYVLRRIMRRAIRYGRKLSSHQSLLPHLVNQLILDMSPFYPELQERQNIILHTVRDEESRFLTTLDQGTLLLEEALNQVCQKGGKQLDGSIAFRLYDTFGFPLDLTRLMAEERGILLDERTFQRDMDESRRKAKASWKGKAMTTDEAHILSFAQEAKNQVGATVFLGYEQMNLPAKTVLLSDNHKIVNELTAGCEGLVVFNQTPIYAEGGGQSADLGFIQGAKGRAQILDCQKQNDVFIHHIKVTEGSLSTQEEVQINVEAWERRNTMANHTATHLLHAALRDILGDHVTQAGSSVDAERLRFDFTHNKPMTFEELRAVEEQVNQNISDALPVVASERSYKEAIENGAMALFGEKYGDKVRVIEVGEKTSVELCGGTHVSNTTQIRIFKIASEGGVSAGVRRIEALSSDGAARFLLKLTQESLQARQDAGLSTTWTQILENQGDSLSQWIEHSRSQIKSLERQLKTLQGQQINLDELIARSTSFQQGHIQGRLVTGILPLDDRQVLSEVCDKIRDKISSGVVILIGKGEDSHPILVAISKNLVETLDAGKILKTLTAELGGRGGGRPDFAQGAIQNLSLAPQVLAEARSLAGLVSEE